MGVTSIVETVHPGEFIVSEGNNTISRQIVTLALAGLILGATILGQVLTGTAAAGAVVGTGNGTISAVTVGANAVAGAYTVVFSAATKFNLYRPDGTQLAQGTTGVAYSSDLGFTITAGGTPFVAGDSITITVTAGSLKYVALTLNGTNGSQTPAAILYETTDTTSADQQAVVLYRHAEVVDFLLTYPAGATTNQKAAINALLLSKCNISVRKSA